MLKLCTLQCWAVSVVSRSIRWDCPKTPLFCCLETSMLKLCTCTVQSSPHHSDRDNYRQKRMTETWNVATRSVGSDSSVYTQVLFIVSSTDRVPTHWSCPLYAPSSHPRVWFSVIKRRQSGELVKPEVQQYSCPSRSIDLERECSGYPQAQNGIREADFQSLIEAWAMGTGYRNEIDAHAKEG